MIFKREVSLPTNVTVNISSWEVLQYLRKIILPKDITNEMSYINESSGKWEWHHQDDRGRWETEIYRESTATERLLFKNYQTLADHIVKNFL